MSSSARMLWGTASVGDDVLVVDLLAPATPHVHLPGVGGDRRDDEFPESWLRLALVRGVDRWFDQPLNEALLRADLALAHASVGNIADAEALWPTAERSVRALLTVIERAPSRFADRPLARELLTLLDAAPYGIATDRLRKQFGRKEADRWRPDAEEEAKRRRARLTQTRPRGGGPQSVRTVIDPRAVAARVVGGPASATASNGTIDVTVPAFATLERSAPIATRLVVRATADGDVVSLGALTLADGAFTGRLHHNGYDPDDVVVDVYDADSLGGPFISEQDREAGLAITRLRDGFTWARIAVAEASLGIADQSARVLAEQRLSDAQLEAPGDVLEVAFSVAGPTRPLLAELAYAQGVAIPA